MSDPDKTLPPHRRPPDREQLLAALAENVPALIAYYDSFTLRCEFANRAYAGANGWTTETILGKTVREVIGDAAWRVIKPQVEIALRGEKVQYQRELILPSGEQRQIEVSLIPHVNRAGEVIAAFVLIIDITRHHRAEQALKESEERLSKFVEATREGIFFHKDGVITDVNDGVTREIGRASCRERV